MLTIIALCCCYLIPSLPLCIGPLDNSTSGSGDSLVEPSTGLPVTTILASSSSSSQWISSSAVSSSSSKWSSSSSSTGANVAPAYIYLSEYGGSPLASSTGNSQALLNAFNAAFALPSAVVVLDSPGAVYNMSAFPQNALSVTIPSNAIPYALTIQGNGATLYFSDNCFSGAAYLCTDPVFQFLGTAGSGSSVTISDLTIDGLYPAFAQGYYVQTIPGTTTLQFRATEAIPDPSFTTTDGTMVLDPALSYVQLGGGCKNLAVVPGSPSLYNLTGCNYTPTAVGTPVAFEYSTTAQTLHFEQIDNVVLESVSVYWGMHTAVTCKFCGNITADRLIVDRKAGRFISVNHGLLIVADTRGDFTVTNSILRWSDDDCINFERGMLIAANPESETLSPVMAVNATTITLNVSVGSLFTEFNSNQVLSSPVNDYNVYNVRSANGAYVTDANGNLYRFTCVSGISNAPQTADIIAAFPNRFYTVVLQGDTSILPTDGTLNGWLFEHVQPTRLYVSNTTFGPSDGTGIVPTTQGSIVIQNSVFNGLNHGGIQVKYSQGSGQGAQPWNMLIDNNQFYANPAYYFQNTSNNPPPYDPPGLARGFISLYSTPMLYDGAWLPSYTGILPPSSPPGGIGNITVSNNVINMPNIAPGMTFGGAQNMSVTNNSIAFTTCNAFTQDIVITNCSGVTTSQNPVSVVSCLNGSNISTGLSTPYPPPALPGQIAQFAVVAKSDTSYKLTWAADNSSVSYLLYITDGYGTISTNNLVYTFTATTNCTTISATLCGVNSAGALGPNTTTLTFNTTCANGTVFPTTNIVYGQLYNIMPFANPSLSATTPAVNGSYVTTSIPNMELLSTEAWEQNQQYIFNASNQLIFSVYAPSKVVGTNLCQSGQAVGLQLLDVSLPSRLQFVYTASSMAFSNCAGAYCLEAQSLTLGGGLIIDYCDSTNPSQQWWLGTPLHPGIAPAAISSSSIASPFVTSSSSHLSSSEYATSSSSSLLALPGPIGGFAVVAKSDTSYKLTWAADNSSVSYLLYITDGYGTISTNNLAYTFTATTNCTTISATLCGVNAAGAVGPNTTTLTFNTTCPNGTVVPTTSLVYGPLFNLMPFTNASLSVTTPVVNNSYITTNPPPMQLLFTEAWEQNQQFVFNASTQLIIAAYAPSKVLGTNLCQADEIVGLQLLDVSLPSRIQFVYNPFTMMLANCGGEYCLEALNATLGSGLIVDSCDEDNPLQQWWLGQSVGL